MSHDQSRSAATEGTPLLPSPMWYAPSAPPMYDAISSAGDGSNGQYTPLPSFGLSQYVTESQNKNGASGSSAFVRPSQHNDSDDHNLDESRASEEYNMKFLMDLEASQTKKYGVDEKYAYQGPEIGEAPKKTSDGFVHMKHNAYFINLMTLAHTILFGYEIYYNDGFESLSVNPLLGPTGQTLKDLGAKYGPNMRSPNDEYYRFVTPIFLHAGVIHLIMNFSFQIRIARQIEQEYGTWRTVVIYMLAGVGGNLASCLFVPEQVQVGASGSLYGMLGCLIVDLVENWVFLQRNKINPWVELFKLLVQVLISLGIGLLPGVDNFAHVGGFIIGTLLGISLLPTTRKQGKTFCAMFRSFLVFLFTILLLLSGFYIFFSDIESDSWCSFCEKIDCLEELFDCEGF
eukprot:TRINITY_DN1713_c0_g1_i1.p1 TRINITY_DN1713_c0_g1~~TRINITY_DN1713_c0_g1_i1.p1  ORF type:complete len:401 (-),score=80.81 TRINITY_DN1713_c0_g1_i1:398-1600(-)